MHTPGPWFVLPDSPAAIRDMTGANIAPEVCHMADARLIAAAPNMLAALQELLADKYLSDPINRDRMAKARAAVALATNKD